jgi:alkylation response protein AidB-like acyl-CoA dehydrogenase
VFPLSDDDLAIQARARAFVDEELIPWEQHAEAHGGGVPPEVAARHEERARELGLLAAPAAPRSSRC